ncbi:hypothetical protein F5146DRAFT_762276 [Armillaria mellea]|nr:hypothetical protein F5146DRAFT_762276 [Armillaria mellea]
MACGRIRRVSCEERVLAVADKGRVACEERVTESVRAVRELWIRRRCAEWRRGESCAEVVFVGGACSVSVSCEEHCVESSVADWVSAGERCRDVSANAAQLAVAAQEEENLTTRKARRVARSRERWGGRRGCLAGSRSRWTGTGSRCYIAGSR